MVVGQIPMRNLFQGQDNMLERQEVLKIWGFSFLVPYTHLSSLSITWPAEGKGHTTLAEEPLEMVEALIRTGPPSHFSRVCSYPFHPLHGVTRGQDHCLSLYFLIQELAAVM